MIDLVKKVEKNILELGLIDRGDKILVAFSGGPDSTALLYALHRLSAKHEFSTAACYINHKIRPRAVRKEIEFCRETCAELHIPFSVIETDIPVLAEELKISLEEAGHRFRKDALAYMADEMKCNKIALGHHLDDLTETVLFRLFRGTGPGGLNPLKPLDSGRIRPLYNISRSEIENYLRAKKIDSMLDKSNQESNYSRNYIRNKIIPVVEKRFGSKYRSSILNFTQILADENRYLDSLAREKLKKAAMVTPGGKIVVDLALISGYDVWLKRRMFKLVLENAGGRPGSGNFEEINRILELPDSHIKALNLTNGLTVARDRTQLIFFGKKTNIGKTEIEIRGMTQLNGIDISIKCTPGKPGRARLEKVKDGRSVSVDYNRLALPLHARGIRPGDSFSPLGMTRTKKIGDFLTDKKVSKYFRDEIPVLFDQKGIIWLVGHQIANRVKIDKTTRKVLTIESIGNELVGIA